MALQGHLWNQGNRYSGMAKVQKRSQKGRERGAEEAGELKTDQGISLRATGATEVCEFHRNKTGFEN